LRKQLVGFNPLNPPGNLNTVFGSVCAIRTHNSKTKRHRKPNSIR